MKLKTSNRRRAHPVKGWFKPKAAAEYCNVGERTLRTWLKEEGLRSSRVRGAVLIKVDWIDEFLEQHELNSSDKVEWIVNQVCKGMDL